MTNEPVVIPAAIAGAAQAIVNLLVLFGVPLSAEQVGGINTAFAAVYVAVAFWSRSRVRPVP